MNIEEIYKELSEATSALEQLREEHNDNPFVLEFLEPSAQFLVDRYKNLAMIYETLNNLEITTQMKIAVVGSRTFSNYYLMEQTLDYLSPSLIISGGARGADAMAEGYAKRHEIPTKVYYPQWEVHGKKAGIIRNRLIVNDAELVIAFWDGVSKGTKFSIEYAKKIGKKIAIFNI